jgi:hypothetical protein
MNTMISRDLDLLPVDRLDSDAGKGPSPRKSLSNALRLPTKLSGLDDTISENSGLFLRTLSSCSDPPCQQATACVRFLFLPHWSGYVTVGQEREPHLPIGQLFSIFKPPA